MKTRVISALIGVPLLLAIIYLGGIYMYIATTLLSIVGYFEFTKANEGKILNSAILTAIFIPFLFLIAYTENFIMLPLFFCILIISNMAYLVIFNSKETIDNIVINIFAFLYVPVSFMFIAYIRDFDNGVYFIIPIFLTAFMSDTFAYFVGKSMGKHKLAPVLSPKKTVEGSVGGIVGAGFIMALYANFFFEKIGGIFPSASKTTIIIIFLVFGLIGGGISQIGDLFASAIKRYRNVKDYGKIMPGHGGVLDRFDSVIILSFVFYALYHVIFYTNFN